MQKKLWISLALLLVITGLLFTASCAKKAVKPEEPLAKISEEEAAREAAERAKQEELERQRAIEEERLKEERLKEEAAKREMIAARNMFINEDIYYDFDRSFITSMAQEVLKRKAEWLQNNPEATVTIEGHCDERGTNEYNLALGDRRCESAKAFLVNLGISESRFTTVSYGEERPVDLGHNEEAWAKNRRAHFVID